MYAITVLSRKFQSRLSIAVGVICMLFATTLVVVPTYAQQGCSVNTSVVQPSPGATVSNATAFTLEIDFLLIGQDCTHVGTGWAIYDAPGFPDSALIQSAPFSTTHNLNSLQISAGMFQPGKQYWWGAIVQVNEFGSFQNYLVDGSFTIAQPGGACLSNDMVAPQNSSPTGNITISEPLTLKIDVLIFVDCQIAGTFWEISDDPNFNSGVKIYSREIANNDDIFELPVPLGVLTPGSNYYWRAQFFAMDGNSFVYGTLSQPSSFWTPLAGGGGGGAVVVCLQNELPEPLPLSPNNDTISNTTPRLSIASLDPGCHMDGSWWVISEDPNFQFDNHSFTREDQLGENLYELNVPPNFLEMGKTYYWSVQFYVYWDNQIQYGISSQPASFTIQGAGNGGGGRCNVNQLPDPFHIAPQDGDSVSLTPTLDIGSLVANCDMDGSWWGISTDPTFATLDHSFFQETALGDDLYQLTIPTNTLQANTTYYWTVAFYMDPLNQPLEFGNVSVATSFRTQGQGGSQPGPGSCNSLPTPVITNPSINATNQSLTPTLRVDYSANPGACVDGSLWWLSDDPNFNTNVASYDGNIVMGGDPLSWTIPAGTLQPNTTYYWVVWFYEATVPTTFGPESQVGHFTTGVGGSGGSPPINPPTNPPGGGSSTLTIPQSVARMVPSDPGGANADQVIGDREIIQAITMWIFGDTVPNTGSQTIGDTVMIDLIKTWIGGMSVNAVGAIPVSTAYAKAELARMAAMIQGNLSTASASAPLAINAVRLQSSGHDRWTLSVNGSGIAGANVQVFDTSGRLLINQNTNGKTLTLLTLDDAGYRLANGVYLYVVTVHDGAGNAVRSNVGKWIVLR